VLMVLSRKVECARLRVQVLERVPASCTQTRATPAPLPHKDLRRFSMADPPPPPDPVPVYEPDTVMHETHAPGTYHVYVRVVVLRPPHVTASGRTLPSTPVVLQSPELVCVVDGDDPLWQAAKEPASVRNVLDLERPRVEASSSFATRGVGHPPEQAIDGRARTSWLARPGDDEPTLVIHLAQALPADRVLLSNARSVPYRPGYYARATQVEVRVNDGPVQVVAMPPDERRSGRLELAPSMAVRKLELRLRWPVEGEVHASVGLCEVELQSD